MSKLNKVLYDVDQSADTSAAERILARKNVGLDFDTEWTRGSAGGLATLDSSGLVPAEQLPSYVDDVIEGYYHDGKFYSDSAHAHEITGELNKIYIDITGGANNASYRYTESGSYIQISAQNTFSTISVDKGDETYDNVTADAVSDTVTLDRGTGIALDVDGKHITVGHTNSVTAGTAGSKAASTGNETLDVPWVDFDSEGHVTGKGTHTHTINTATNATKGVVTLTDTIGSQDAATGGLGLSPKAVHSLGGAIYAAQYYQSGLPDSNAVHLLDVELVNTNANTVIRGLVNYTYVYNSAGSPDCYGLGSFELVVAYNPSASSTFSVLEKKIYWTNIGHVKRSTPEFQLGYTFDQSTMLLSVYAVYVRSGHYCGVNVQQATCENVDMRQRMTFVANPGTMAIPAGIGYLDNIDGLPTKVTSWSGTVSDSNVPSEKLVKDYIDALSSSLPTKVNSWSNPLSNNNVPSERLVKTTIDNLDSIGVKYIADADLNTLYNVNEYRFNVALCVDCNNAPPRPQIGYRNIYYIRNANQGHICVQRATYLGGAIRNFERIGVYDISTEQVGWTDWYEIVTDGGNYPRLSVGYSDKAYTDDSGNAFESTYVSSVSYDTANDYIQYTRPASNQPVNVVSANSIVDDGSGIVDCQLNSYPPIAQDKAVPLTTAIYSPGDHSTFTVDTTNRRKAKLQLQVYKLPDQTGVIWQRESYYYNENVNTNAGRSAGTQISWTSTDSPETLPTRYYTVVGHEIINAQNQGIGSTNTKYGGLYPDIYGEYEERSEFIDINYRICRVEFDCYIGCALVPVPGNDADPSGYQHTFRAAIYNAANQSLNFKFTLPDEDRLSTYSTFTIIGASALSSKYAQHVSITCDKRELLRHLGSRLLLGFMPMSNYVGPYWREQWYEIQVKNVSIAWY